MKKKKDKYAEYTAEELERKIYGNMYYIDGLFDGKREGLNQQAFETAQYLLDKGFEENIILEATGLSLKELNELREKNSKVS